MKNNIELCAYTWSQKTKYILFFYFNARFFDYSDRIVMYS